MKKAKKPEEGKKPAGGKKPAREKSPAGAKPPRRRLRMRLLWAAGKIALVPLGLALAAVLVFAFANPRINYYIVSEHLRLGGSRFSWVPIEEVPPRAPLALVAAEDARFCEHHGFDFEEIGRVLAEGERRGASTISQQVAKNVFLWPGRSWARKGLEAGFTVLIELVWTKRRIIEVYMNVAEFDEGVFGIQAAARHYFGVEASGLSPMQASLLAAVLPDPKGRSASRPSAWVRARAGRILDGLETLIKEDRAGCLAELFQKEG